MNFKQIIKNYSNDLLSLNNVVGIGQGIKQKNGKMLKQKCITVLVKNKVPQKQLNSYEQVPQNIEEKETDVIEVGDVELLSQNNTRLNKSRPAQPGVSIGHYKITAGTFGAVVKDKKTGQLLILSNNHVLANISDGRDGRAYKGDEILQPGSYDGGGERDIIAYLERFAPIYNNEVNERGKASYLSRGFTRLITLFNNILSPSYRQKNNKIDGAVAKPKSEDIIEQEIIGIGKVNGTVQPKLGMKVIKSGRTTGVTSSIIKAVDVTIKVRLSDNASTYFSDQILADSFSRPGDSGSLVVDKNNRAVGLLFAGSKQSSIFNRIDNVCENLEIEI